MNTITELPAPSQDLDLSNLIGVPFSRLHLPNLPVPEPRKGLSAPSDPPSLESKRTLARTPPDVVPEAEDVSRETPKCIVGYFVNPETGETIPALCKSSRCEDCGPKLSRRLAKRLRDCRVDLSRMMTLTLPAGFGVDCRATVKLARKVFRKFMARIRRRHPGLRYAWCLEVGALNDMVHFHVAIDQYIDWKVVNAQWVASGGGKVTDVRRGSVGYITKYLAKVSSSSSAAVAALRGSKLWSCSRGLLVPVARLAAKGVWKFHAITRGVTAWLTRPGQQVDPRASVVMPYG